MNDQSKYSKEGMNAMKKRSRGATGTVSGTVPICRKIEICNRGMPDQVCSGNNDASRRVFSSHRSSQVR